MASLFRPIYARKLFDITWADILRAISFAVSPHRHDPKAGQAATERLENLWAPSQTIVALSVRSAFDLLLRTCDYPPGSEVIISAVTIPHMVAIIRLHGLVPVPVDLEQTDAGVSATDIAALITPRTKAILVAQLFGARHSLARLGDLARQRSLLLIEDCAQAFRGLDFVGSPEAAVSMFSFGPIKTCTCLGGGIVTVREPGLLEGMKARQAGYETQRPGTFFIRIVKYAAFHAVTQSPYCYGVLIAALRLLGKDHHRTITKFSHSLTADADLLEQIRLKPANALVELLHYRVSHFDPTSLDRRAARIADIVRGLPASLYPIGYKGPSADFYLNHHYWICPIRVGRPSVVLDELLVAGFDAAAGNASLAVVSHGDATGVRREDDREKAPPKATEMMASLVYLPVDNAFNPQTVERLVKVLQVAGEQN